MKDSKVTLQKIVGELPGYHVESEKWHGARTRISGSGILFTAAKVAWRIRRRRRRRKRKRKRSISPEVSCHVLLIKICSKEEEEDDDNEEEEEEEEVA